MISHIVLCLAKALGGLIFLGVLFIPLERAFSARPGQVIFRPRWILDLSFFWGQKLLWGGAALAMLHFTAPYLQATTPLFLRQAVAARPLWVQAVAVVVLSDFLIYWAHRLQHRVEVLWKFHSVHHTSEHLDWLAAHREHPLDTFYTVGIINLPAILLGFPIQSLVGLIAFRGLWAIFIHSNVRLPIGPLRMLIGAPELHHWHHDRDRDAGNYGNLSPIMDLLFGTYSCPTHEPEAFGVNESMPQTYWGLLLHPFRWRRSPEFKLSTSHLSIHDPSSCVEMDVQERIVPARVGKCV